MRGIRAAGSVVAAGVDTQRRSGEQPCETEESDRAQQGYTDTDQGRDEYAECAVNEQSWYPTTLFADLLRTPGGDLLLHPAGKFLEDLSGVTVHEVDGAHSVNAVHTPHRPARVDRPASSTTVTLVRPKNVLLTATLLLLAVGPLTACTTERVVVIEQTAAQAPPAQPVSAVSSTLLTAALQRFLDAALAGLPTDLLLAGDRFVVITPVDILEVTSLRARGDVRMISLDVPGACAVACHALLGEVLTALRADLDSSASSTEIVRAQAPLEGWPTLEVASERRSWRLSFDETGRGLFVIELLAGDVRP